MGAFHLVTAHEDVVIYQLSTGKGKSTGHIIMIIITIISTITVTSCSCKSFPL